MQDVGHHPHIPIMTMLALSVASRPDFTTRGIPLPSQPGLLQYGPYCVNYQIGPLIALRTIRRTSPHPRAYDLRCSDPNWWLSQVLRIRSWLSDNATSDPKRWCSAQSFSGPRIHASIGCRAAFGSDRTSGLAHNTQEPGGVARFFDCPS